MRRIFLKQLAVELDAKRALNFSGGCIARLTPSFVDLKVFKDHSSFFRSLIFLKTVVSLISTSLKVF